MTSCFIFLVLVACGGPKPTRTEPPTVQGATTATETAKSPSEVLLDSGALVVERCEEGAGTAVRTQVSLTEKEGYVLRRETCGDNLHETEGWPERSGVTRCEVEYGRRSEEGYYSVTFAFEIGPDDVVTLIDCVTVG